MVVKDNEDFMSLYFFVKLGILTDFFFTPLMFRKYLIERSSLNYMH